MFCECLAGSAWHACFNLSATSAQRICEDTSAACVAICEWQICEVGQAVVGQQRGGVEATLCQRHPVGRTRWRVAGHAIHHPERGCGGITALRGRSRPAIRRAMGSAAGSAAPSSLGGPRTSPTPTCRSARCESLNAMRRGSLSSWSATSGGSSTTSDQSTRADSEPNRSGTTSDAVWRSSITACSTLRCDRSSAEIGVSPSDHSSNRQTARRMSRSLANVNVWLSQIHHGVADGLHLRVSAAQRLVAECVGEAGRLP